MGYSYVCLFHPPGCFVFSLFAFLSLFLCRSVFDLLCLLLRCPVLASLLRVFFFLSLVASSAVGYLSSFSLVVVRFSCVSFLSLGVVYSFRGSPCLLHPSLLSVVLTSSLLPLLILSFFAVGSGMLSSPLSPLSSLRWLCPALVPGFQFSLVLFCFRFPSLFFSLFVFSPRCLLLLPSWAPLGVQLPSCLSLAPRFLGHSWISYLALGFTFSLFFPSFYAFHCAIPLPFSRRFLVFPCTFLVSV